MRSRILIASFIFLIAAPSYMISERYGITGGSEIKPVDVSVILKCDSIDNVDFVLTPEEGAKNGIIKASINLKDGRVFKSRDCEEVTLFFEKMHLTRFNQLTSLVRNLH